MRKNKTDLILEYFEKRPNTEFTPRDVGEALGLEPKSVATILGRLTGQGLLKKAGRGRFLMRPSVSYDCDAIVEEVRSALEGSIGKEMIVSMKLDQQYKDLESFLNDVSNKFGRNLACNLVKQAIENNCKPETARALLNKLGL
jgi:DNA-binding GntR family transcriptional regulator